MVQKIIHNEDFLKVKSTDASIEDINTIGKDLLDTLLYESEKCVGMAANMIGHSKRLIAFIDQETDKLTLMVNPVLLSKSEEYKAKEGCLSLKGEREATRYKKIKVQYYDYNMKIKIKTYVGFTAQIIQHEMDHLEGILI